MVSLYYREGRPTVMLRIRSLKATKRALQADYLALGVQSMMFTSCHGF